MRFVVLLCRVKTAMRVYFFKSLATSRCSLQYSVKSKPHCEFHFVASKMVRKLYTWKEKRRVLKNDLNRPYLVYTATTTYTMHGWGNPYFCKGGFMAYRMSSQ